MWPCRTHGLCRCCVCVCCLVGSSVFARIAPQKRINRLRCCLREQTRVGPSNHVLDWVLDILGVLDCFRRLRKTYLFARYYSASSDYALYKFTHSLSPQECGTFEGDMCIGTMQWVFGNDAALCKITLHTRCRLWPVCVICEELINVWLHFSCGCCINGNSKSNDRKVN